MIFKKTAALLIPAMVLGAVDEWQRSRWIITNGSFETTTGYGQMNYNSVVVSGWTNTNDNTTTSGYNFIYSPTNFDNGTGVTGVDGSLQLWGPNNGSANGLGASPDGGNFVASDGVYQSSAITQMATGLTIGQNYAVSFWYGGAQQESFSGATTEGWQVSFGSQTQTTAMLNNSSHGFTGWVHESFDFVAQNTSQLLSFLAVDTPVGDPPFSLLDGVSISQTVPEPSSLILMGLGLIGFGVIRFKRRRVLSGV